LRAGLRRPISLTGNQRQRDPWEQQALVELRRGDVLTAVDDYRAHDRVRTASSVPQLHDRLVADYAAARSAGADVLILTTGGPSRRPERRGPRLPAGRWRAPRPRSCRCR
jgi:hypothetical protein